MQFRRALSLTLVVISVALPTLARAAPDDEAQRLFDRGRALVADGRIAEGCRALEQSQALDPSAGTLLNLALCHEAEGETPLARSELEASLTIAERDGRDDRAAIAREHLAALPAATVSDAHTLRRHRMGLELVVTIAVFFASGMRRRYSPLPRSSPRSR